MVRPGNVRPSSFDEVPLSERSQQPTPAPTPDTARSGRNSLKRGAVAAWRGLPEKRPALNRPGGIINLIWVEGSEGSGLRVT